MEPLLSFEILIINDLSIDETQFLKEKYFNNYTNIFIYNNIKRQNFLINCYKAVELSKWVLQEAGGIVWNNGKCSNYGNGERTDLP